MIWGIIVAFLERIGLAWWKEHKDEEAENVQNDVAGMSDADLYERLRNDWTKH